VTEKHIWRNSLVGNWSESQIDRIRSLIFSDFKFLC